MERGPAPPEELATGNGGTLGGGTDGKDGPEGGIGDEGSLRTQPDVKEEDPLAEDNITEMRPLIAGSQAEVKGSGDGSSRAHLYRVSRYYCQCLQRTMEEFVERVNAAPLDEALFYRQEPEEVKQAAEIKERKEPSSHLLKMLTERDEPIGDAMVGFLARLHSTKQELQKILKDIKIKEDLVEAIGGKAHRSTGSQEDVISQDKEGTVSGKTGAVRNKRRLLDTMHFMSETRNASLLQMTKVTLGDCKDPGLAVSLCPLDCFVLAAALRPHGIVEELNISHCSIGPEGIQQLSSVLHLCKTLRLSWNNLGDSGVKILCSSLRQPDCEIQELWVDYNGLTAVGTRNLASAVAKNRSVVLLTLSYNKVGEATMKFLGDALKGRGCTLQYLRLCGMGITNSYCRQLAWALCANRSLTALDLDNNQLGDSGATQLCAALMKPDCKIQSLRLGSNRLTGLCTLELMHALNVNRSLRQLNLNYNRLGLPGVQRLSAALKRPTCRLQKLEAAALIASRSSHSKGQAVSDLQCCNNDDIIRGDFQTENTNWFMGSHMVELNCPMRLDENGLRDACAEELASALSTNRSLRGLYLNRNSFTDRSIPAFHSLTKSCTSLRYIWLWRNQFSPEGRNQLQSMKESVRRVTVFV